MNDPLRDARVFPDDPEIEALISELAPDLVESLRPASPRSELKARLMKSVALPELQPQQGRLGAVLFDSVPWKASDHPGISFKTLYFDKAAGLVTMLVRMEPGSCFPAHWHDRPERCLVLEGDLIHRDHVYHRGDFTWAEPGTEDPELRTEHGNLLLLIAPPEKRRPTRVET